MDTRTVAASLFWLPHLLSLASGHFMEEQWNSNLVRFLSNSIEKDFQQNGDPFVIQYRAASQESHRKLDDTVGEVLRRCSGKVIWHLRHLHTSEFSYKIKNVVMFIDSYESLRREIGSGNMSSIFGIHVKFLVVLMASREDSDEMRRIFHLLNSLYVLRAVIAVSQGVPNQQEISLYTYSPFEAGQCGSSRPKLVGSYKGPEDSKDFSSLYEPLKTNLNGCPLKVALTPIGQFIKLDNQSNNTLQGIDAEHIKVLSEKLNFTVRSMLVPMHGKVLPNGSVTGVFEKLHNRQADFSISGLSYFPDRVRLFSASVPYYQGSIYIALEVDTSYHPIDSTLRPYQTDVWLLLVTLFAARSLILACLRLYPVIRVPPWIRRFMTAMWLIAMFYHRTFYESVYYSFMQRPAMVPLPSTLREMSAQGYTVLADFSTMGFFDYFSEYNDTVRRVALVPDEAFDLVNFQQRIAIATKLEPFAMQMSDHPAKRNSFIIMPEVLFVDYFCVYFPRNSYLKMWFDAVLSEMVAAGLMRNYLQRYVGSIDRYFKSSMAVNYEASNADSHTISLYHLKSVFIIYFIGLAIAAAVLCLEHWAPHVPLLNRLLE